SDTAMPVALKLVKDDDDPGARLRFLQEARAASTVSHANIVKVLEVLELEDGAPVLVMELLVGESLADRLLRERRLSLAAAADLLIPVVSALGTAHAAGVVHRDLKPENIFLAQDGEGGVVPKVLDFGIAKLTPLDEDTMRSTGITTGAVL